MIEIVKHLGCFGKRPYEFKIAMTSLCNAVLVEMAESARQLEVPVRSVKVPPAA